MSNGRRFKRAAVAERRREAQRAATAAFAAEQQRLATEALALTVGRTVDKWWERTKAYGHFGFDVYELIVEELGDMGREQAQAIGDRLTPRLMQIMAAGQEKVWEASLLLETTDFEWPDHWPCSDEAVNAIADPAQRAVVQAAMLLEEATEEMGDVVTGFGVDPEAKV